LVFSVFSIFFSLAGLPKKLCRPPPFVCFSSPFVAHPHRPPPDFLPPPPGPFFLPSLGRVKDSFFCKAPFSLPVFTLPPLFAFVRQHCLGRLLQLSPFWSDGPSHSFFSFLGAVLSCLEVTGPMLIRAFTPTPTHNLPWVVLPHFGTLYGSEPLVWPHCLIFFFPQLPFFFTTPRGRRGPCLTEIFPLLFFFPPLVSVTAWTFIEKNLPF